MFVRQHGILGALVLGLVAMPAVAVDGSFDRLTPDDGAGQVEFKHLLVNDAGQYVAVTRSQVYVGSAREGTLRKVFDNNRYGFVVVDDQRQHDRDRWVELTFEQIGTRLALNEQGDFVLASNQNLWVGNVASDELRSVLETDNHRFLQVLLNDQGHYLAVSNRNLYGGHVQDAAASPLLADASGTFAGFTIQGTQGNWYVETGETHAALNAKGQFVAASSGALYVGSVPDRSVKKLFEDSRTGFRQVALEPSGAFVAVSVKHVYRGTIQ